MGGTGNSWGWELNSNRIYNAGEIILPVCNLERPADSALSEKFEETDKVQFNIDEENEVFDEQNELNKLYHYPNSRNFSKFQEKFKCPSEFYMSKFIFNLEGSKYTSTNEFLNVFKKYNLVLDCNSGKIGFGSETDWYGWCFDSLKGLNLYPGKVKNRFQFQTLEIAIYKGPF